MLSESAIFALGCRVVFDMKKVGVYKGFKLVAVGRQVRDLNDLCILVEQLTDANSEPVSDLSQLHARMAHVNV